MGQNAGMNTPVWTVGALCKAVSDALAARFDAVRVQGEISGFTQAASGHCYFSLKDAQGQLRCAMFRRAASMLGRLPRNGDQVEVVGRLGVYGARGDLQLVVESMQALGQGALYEEFLRLKSKLQAEGLFDPGLKRPLTPRPRGIGLVTSLGAAALHDVATALERRVAHIPVVLAPALVQGVGAPQSLQAALLQLYQRRDLDVILLVRGGGSIEDLWAFNDEALVRLLRQSPVPVVCGVGHETDFALCDFAADLRAPPPTAAAELCALSRADSMLQLGHVADLARAVVWRRLDEQTQHLDRLQQALARPQGVLQIHQRRLARLALALSRSAQEGIRNARDSLSAQGQRMPLSMQRLCAQQHHRLDTVQAKLALLDPRHVLDRGYSWLIDHQGHAMTRVAQFQPGQSVSAVLSDGEVGLKVVPRNLQG